MFWSKKFVLSDTNSLEQFADRPEVANSLNNFKQVERLFFEETQKHGAHGYMETWMPLLIDVILGT